MKHIGLFEGIGGFSLAARWVGWETIAWCEWNEFGQKVLNYHFPKAKGHGDITKTDFTIYRGQCDILTGGFPCQPYSAAGKRKGKEDERHLWPEMLRAIREIRPRYVVGENVRGLTNWNGGMVFDEVQADLEAEGYEVLPFLLPACAVNAPHRRDRIWFVAYSSGNGHESGGFGENRQTQGKSIGLEKKRQWFRGDGRGVGESGSSPNPNICTAGSSGSSGEIESNRSKNNDEQKGGRQGESRQFNENSAINNWQNFPTEPPVRGGNDGISERLDGITFPKWRNESIKADRKSVV